MKKTISLFAFVLLAVVGMVWSVNSTEASGNRPSANGHGNLTQSDGSLRTFSFHALTKKDGTVDGSLTLHSRLTDTFIKADIDCLVVEDNRARMSGTITRSDNPDFVDRKFRFNVEDNGEGENDPPDGLSLFQPLPAEFPADCTELSDLPLFPIEGGNIQVK